MEETRVINPDVKGLLSLGQEWLETNGLGGYASSTALNCHTRKYHGLLVAADLKTTDRFVLLSKFDESIIFDDHNYLLNYHYYLPGILIPNDDPNILKQEFNSQINPQWKYFHPDFEIHKELIMPHGFNTTLLKYTLKTKKKISLKLKLRPLIAQRSFHHLSKENSHYNFNFETLVDGIKTSPYQNMPELLIQTNADFDFSAEPCWYRNFSYQEEKHRGYDSVEDLASPGYFSIELENNKPVYVSASSEIATLDHEEVWKKEIQRRKKLTSKNPQFFAMLEKSAADFIVKTPDHNLAVIAGYHWFGSWGRDTMISLPGLFLKTSYQDDFKKVIRHYLNFQQDGLIPNIIGKDKENSAYNSVDAALWLFWAVQQFALELKIYDWIEEEIWEDLKNIFNAYSISLPPLVKCTNNGLLETGNENESLSWMDACINGKSVIPRYGFLVEINALWFNAVSFVEELALRFEDPISKRAGDLKIQIEKSFTEAFYNKQAGYLADYVRDGVQNLQIRPNQVLAISMPYSPITQEISKKILSIVIEELFTPIGLRTLSPQDPDYRGIYEGVTETRDSAYHNGTVWPWLIGPFGDALLKVNSDKTKAKQQVQYLIDGFINHAEEANLELIPEICDGNTPHAARGCISQAWSMAEIRRLILKTK